MLQTEDILTILRKHKSQLSIFGVSEVGLFGSYCRNEQTSESDIDILIDFEPDQERFDNFMAVCDLLESFFVNEKIDVLTRNGLSKHLEPSILKEVLYV